MQISEELGAPLLFFPFKTLHTWVCLVFAAVQGAKLANFSYIEMKFLVKILVKILTKIWRFPYRFLVLGEIFHVGPVHPLKLLLSPIATIDDKLKFQDTNKPIYQKFLMLL